MPDVGSNLGGIVGAASGSSQQSSSSSNSSGGFNPLGIIGSGVSLFNSIMSRSDTKKANAQNEAFSREMYDRQRSDAIADRTFENDYNSPANIMKRYKDGGLNPYLVGQNGVGSSLSVHTGQASVSPVKREVPNSPLAGVGQGIDQYMDLRLKEQQLDNLKTQEKLMTAQDVLAVSKAQGSDYQNIMSQILLYPQGDPSRNNMGDIYQNGLYGNMQQTKLQDLVNKTGIEMDENQRRQLLNDSKVGEITQRIKLMSSQGQNLDQIRSNLEKDGQLKDLQIRFNSVGLNNGDVGKWIGYILQAFLKK